MKKIIYCISITVFLISAAGGFAQHHVAVSGTARGDGSITDPWGIQTAFNHPPGVQPGDTIWLHGGVYDLSGRLISDLSGSPGKPIIVRQYPGESAVINTGDHVENALQINGQYTWYWGFQVTSGAEGRESDPEDNYHPHRGKAVNIGKSDENVNNPGHQVHQPDHS